MDYQRRQPCSLSGIDHDPMYLDGCAETVSYIYRGANSKVLIPSHLAIVAIIFLSFW